MANYFQPKDWRIQRQIEQANTTLSYGGLPTVPELPTPTDPFGRFLGKMTPEYAKRFANQPPEAIRHPTPQQLKDQLATFGESALWMYGAAAPGLVSPTAWRAGLVGKTALGAKVAKGALLPAEIVERIPEYAIKGLGKGIGKTAGTVGRILTGRAKAIPEEELPVAVGKFRQLLVSAEKTLPQTRALRKAERRIRVARAAKELENQGLSNQEAFAKARTLLAGELPTAPLKGELSVISPEEYAELTTFIRRTPKLRFFERIGLEDSVKTLALGQTVQKNQIRLLRDVLGINPEVLSSEWGRKVWMNAIDVAGLPRAVLASIDLSGSLRQGVILAARHPIEWGKSQWPMLKAFAGEKWATQIDDIMRSDPMFASAVEMRSKNFELYIAPLGGQLEKREEMFATRFARYIPGIAQSERAYLTVLNQLRFRSFKSTAQVWEKMGLANERNLDYLARLINIASGRGEVGPLRGMAPLMNATLFSPRLFLARWQYPLMLLDPRVPAPVRVEQMKQLVSFLGAGTGILSLLKLSGVADVETDPRSADFMKARIGNTRLDVWGGFQQYVRFVTQMITMQRMAQDGEIQDVTRDELILNFGQSKFSPPMGLFWDIMRGKSYMGEEMSLEKESLLKQVYNRLTPLFIQDMIDAYTDLGATGLAVASPGVLGVGVTTYGGGEVNLGPRVSEEGTPSRGFSGTERNQIFGVPKSRGGMFTEGERRKLFGR